MTTTPPPGPTQRQLRVGEIVRHALAEVLAAGRLADPELDGLILTVPEVRMSPDLKHATCFVVALGRTDGDRIARALDRNARWLRGQVARKVDLKFSPDLKFRADTRFDDDVRVSGLLKSEPVVRDLDDEQPEAGR